MVAEKQLNEFVSRMRAAGGENLQSIILYGSAVSSEFHSGFSDLNLLCILHSGSFVQLSAISPVVEWWNRQQQRVPLLFTRNELQRSSDVFSIELLDMQRQHQVLFGEDVLKDLHISTHLHRVQVEYELREKLILVRQGLLLHLGNKRQLWQLMLSSLPAFTTLFRHALIALGQPAPGSAREAIQELAAKVQCDPSAFLQLLDIRENKAERKNFDVGDVFARYLASIEGVTGAVDAMLDSTAPERSS